MNIQELATAMENDIPVKVAIMNNMYLGMVRQWQELFYNRRYSYTNMKGQPDFVKVAEAYGAVGIEVERTADVKDAIMSGAEERQAGVHRLQGQPGKRTSSRWCRRARPSTSSSKHRRVEVMSNGNGIEQPHTLSVLVANKPGVLTHVSGLFSRRGYNIDSLTVGVTENPDISRMTIVAHGDEHVIEQVTKQLNKLIDIIKVVEIAPHGVRRPGAGAASRYRLTPSNRSEIIQIVDIFRAKIIDVSAKSVVIEITGGSDKIDALEEMMRPFGIKEMVRTGKVALIRGGRLTQFDK